MLDSHPTIKHPILSCYKDHGEEWGHYLAKLKLSLLCTTLAYTGPRTHSIFVLCMYGRILIELVFIMGRIRT